MRRECPASCPVGTALRSETDLAARINAEHQAAAAASMRWVEHACRAGELLIAAKARLPHGQWMPWLRKHIRFSPRTSAGYMRIARRWKGSGNSRF